jgi:hypothetical protein
MGGLMGGWVIGEWVNGTSSAWIFLLIFSSCSAVMAVFRDESVL